MVSGKNVGAWDVGYKPASRSAACAKGRFRGGWSAGWIGDGQLAGIIDGQFFEDRGNHLAWATPFGPEIDQHGRGGFQYFFVKFAIGYLMDMFAHRRLRRLGWLEWYQAGKPGWVGIDRGGMRCNAAVQSFQPKERPNASIFILCKPWVSRYARQGFTEYSGCNGLGSVVGVRLE